MAKQDVFEAIEAIDPSLVEGKDKDDFTADELDNLWVKAQTAADDANGDDSDAEEAAAESYVGRVVGNARETGPCRFSGITLAAKGKKTIDPKTEKEVGDSVKLTSEHCSNKPLMAKLARNIGSGMLEWRD